MSQGSKAATRLRARFTKISAAGKLIKSGDHVAVHDAETNLIWTRSPLKCGALPWKEALAQASALRLFGATDWIAPATKHYFSIIDHSEFGPALVTPLLDSDGSWEWTSTIDVQFPSGVAWLVNLHDGYVYRNNQTTHDHVRAVRAGQLSDFGIESKRKASPKRRVAA